MKEVWVAFTRKLKAEDEVILGQAERVQDLLREMREKKITGYQLEKRKVKDGSDSS